MENIASISTASTDANPVNDSSSVTVRVNAPPVASFTFSPSTPLVDEEVLFDGTGSTDDVGVVELRVGVRRRRNRIGPDHEPRIRCDRLVCRPAHGQRRPRPNEFDDPPGRCRDPLPTDSPPGPPRHRDRARGIRPGRRPRRRPRAARRGDGRRRDRPLGAVFDHRRRGRLRPDRPELPQRHLPGHRQRAGHDRPARLGERGPRARPEHHRPRLRDRRRAGLAVPEGPGPAADRRPGRPAAARAGDGRDPRLPQHHTSWPTRP